MKAVKGLAKNLECLTDLKSMMQKTQILGGGTGQADSPHTKAPVSSVVIASHKVNLLLHPPSE